MIFATYWFFALGAIFFPVYWLLDNARLRIWLIAIASVIFHMHYAGPAGVIPIITLGIIVYLLGLSTHKVAYLFGIGCCVVALLSYKYVGFFSESLIGHIRPDLGNKLFLITQSILPSSPPLAISFFAFELIHYLVDRYKGSYAIKNVLEFGLFAIFFPTLVAGPIKRYEQFLPALRLGLSRINSRDIMRGMMQCAFGYMKKLIADNLAIWIQQDQPHFSHLSLGWRWGIFAAIGLRILFDFSGYSDIAIGLARMMGIFIPANFNWPYLSTNIREFWHRWHISLSTWIRDYVYIPLGGNRYGNCRRLLNGLIAFSLCGLWHGPAWNFVLWGLYHGIGLSLSNTYKKIPLGIGSNMERVFCTIPILSWLLTLLFVWCGWLLFFYPVPKVLEMIRLLFTPFHP